MNMLHIETYRMCLSVMCTFHEPDKSNGGSDGYISDMPASFGWHAGMSPGHHDAVQVTMVAFQRIFLDLILYRKNSNVERYLNCRMPYFFE
ncbi:hypothetical protein VMCG_04383 [Cytospora schulzeri]|uniref:Uncharacterized protein n=1 Tax=Cytospora schulzeri TaxID=448051 RepID=A0A423WSG4_9PEZI|nr:hypothetical protein VMCG_04383 [Valsa malicola]